MKQFILSYKDFLNSQKLDETVLTPEQSEKYKNIKVVEDVKKLHDIFFNGAERIYLPFNEDIDDSKKSKTQETIENLFSNSNYEIISYIDNKCVKKGDKNITKIGKVLRDKKGFNNEKLAEEYGQDISKLRGVSKTVSNLSVVISRNSDDIASMSTNRAWDSCQNLNPNRFSNYLKEYVAKDLEQGSIIAYLIKTDDKEISDPEARILLKPFINRKNSKDIVFLPCTKVYHRGTNQQLPQKYPTFSPFVMAWAKEVQPNMEGTYKMNDIVYNDGDTEMTIFSKKDMERIENPKTQEDFELVEKYYDINIYYDKVKPNENGLFEYTENLYIKGNTKISETPKFLEKFYKIKNLSLDGCSGLKDIKSLRNLRDVKILHLGKTSVKYLNDLENLETIEELYINHTNVVSLEPLKNIKSIEYLDINNCLKLNSLKGLENVIVQRINPISRVQEYIDINKDVQERIKTLKNEEDFKFVGSILNIELDVLKMEIDSEGFVTYNGDLNFDSEIEEIPKFFERFKNINGYLNFHNCKKLKSLNGFRNLEYVSTMDLRYCYKIQNFKDLKNIKTIECLVFSFTDYFVDNKLTLDGLENVTVLDFMGYSEGIKEYAKINKRFLDTLNNPKTEIEYYNLFKLFGQNNFTKDEIKINKNGLIDYKESYIYLSENDIPDIEGLKYKNSSEVFEYFENLYGVVLYKEWLDINKNFKCFKNLKKLKNIEIYNSSNIDFTGLENVDVEKISDSKEFLRYLEINKEKAKGVYNPKTREDLKYSLGVFGLNKNSIEFDSKNLIKYSSTINIDDRFKEIPKFFKYIKSVYGLKISSKTLTSLKGFDNLEIIEKDFKIDDGWNYKTLLKDFTGLKRLKNINGTFEVPRNFTSKNLKGLENVKINRFENESISYFHAMMNEGTRAILENPKTVEDFEYCFKVLKLDYYINNFEIGEDGLLVLNNNKKPYINLGYNNFKNIPRCLNYIKSAGTLNLANNENLENLENLGGLETVEELNVNLCKNLKNFKGLENCKNIDLLKMDYLDNFQSFEGLENCTIGKIEPQEKYKQYLKFKNKDIEKYLENPKSKEELIAGLEYLGLNKDFINIDEDLLISYTDGKGKWYDYAKIETSNFKENINILSRFKYIGELNVNNDLEDFKIFKNLKGLSELNIHNDSKIKNFEGLENVESVRNITCAGTNIESFKGLEGLKGDINYIDCSETNIVNFKGLEGVSRIRTLTMKKCSKFKSFTGLENVDVDYIPTARYNSFLKWKEKIKK